MKILNKRGSTLLENVIALAIFSGSFLAILHFSMMFMLKYSPTITNKAILLANNEIEKTVQQKNYFNEEIHNKSWIIVKKVKKEKRKIHINVQIYWRNKQSLQAQLHTIRIIKKDLH